MIEHPKRNPGPHVAKWFYSICECGKLLRVVDGLIPPHQFTIESWDFEQGMRRLVYDCNKGGTLHRA